MRSKLLWTLVSTLVVLSLVAVSCGQKEAVIGEETSNVKTDTSQQQTQEQPKQEQVEKQEFTVSSGKPEYGGRATLVISGDPGSLDAGAHPGPAAFLGTIYQQLVGRDWRRTPAGSGEANFAVGDRNIDDIAMPQLSDSWETPEQGTWVMHIRQGARWQPVDSEAGRLMSNREFTADDVVAVFDRLMAGPSSWFYIARRALAKSASVTKTGPWEVTIKVPGDYLMAYLWMVQGAGGTMMYPPEVVEKYGNLDDWRNAVGTGPYMLVDYVRGSTLTYDRNPTYWEENPMGTGAGDQLPYLDGFKTLVIPDLSTQHAALRTGKIDTLGATVLEDGDQLIKQSPELEYLRYLPSGRGANDYVFSMRMDLPDSPFHDLRVRQAMMMAIDFETIKQQLYGGHASTPDMWPVNEAMEGYGYVSLDEMPENVQELYSYNPDKARQLLADAGFPQGFKTSVVLQNTPVQVDEVSVYKDMWAKVGIDVDLDAREAGAYRAVDNSRNFEGLLFNHQPLYFPMSYYFSSFRGSSTMNDSRVNDPEGSDPIIEQAYNDMQQVVFADDAKFYQIFAELRPYLLEQVFAIPKPIPHLYVFWWPWLNNYYGQGEEFIRYAWIDRPLKKSMGY